MKCCLLSPKYCNCSYRRKCFKLCMIELIHKNSVITEVLWQNCMKELKDKIQIDVKRSVCNKCHMVGHNNNSKNCIVNIKRELMLIEKLKSVLIKSDILDEIDFDKLSNELQISLSYCKLLYSKISYIDLINRPLSLDNLSKKLKINQNKCYDCGKILTDIYKNTTRLWKNNTLCDFCWCLYNTERDKIWDKIEKYKKIQCCLCHIRKEYNEQRFHYDHISMFNKSDSICNMVNEGTNIDLIYEELDKCQILCINCHHIITYIENKYPFTRIKQNLTKNLNNNSISNEYYIDQCILYDKIYNEKMTEIYNYLQNNE